LIHLDTHVVVTADALILGNFDGAVW